MCENEIHFGLCPDTLFFYEVGLVGNDIFDGGGTFSQLTQGCCPGGRVSSQSIEQSGQYFLSEYFSEAR
jgi:hypothetical protein